MADAALRSRVLPPPAGRPRAGADRLPLDLPTSAQRVLSAAGAPLSATERSYFEPRFGYDFSHVQVHAGEDARLSTEEVSARAYAVGRHIVLGEPTARQPRLMAHELAHVVQSDRGAPLALRREPCPPLPAQRKEPETVGPPSPPPFFGRSAASTAFKGIVPFYKLRDGALPHADKTVQTFRRGPYLIAPNLAYEGEDLKVAYFIAFRIEPGLLGPTNWNEWAIGPDSIDAFLSTLQGYVGAGAMAYMFGPPAPNAVEGARFVDAVMAGQAGEAAAAWKDSLIESMKDPGWWIQMITATAGMAKGPAPTSAPPKLTLIRGGGGRVVGAPAGGFVAATRGATALEMAPATAPVAARALTVLPGSALPAPASPLIPPELAPVLSAAIATQKAAVQSQKPAPAPAPAPASKVSEKKGDGSSLPVMIYDWNDPTMPAVTENIYHAQKAGWPRILTYIYRPRPEKRTLRGEALRDVPVIETRDEYPFASTVEHVGSVWVGHAPKAQQDAQGLSLIRFYTQHGAFQKGMLRFEVRVINVPPGTP